MNPGGAKSFWFEARAAVLQARGGFALIELLVVIAILAAVKSGGHFTFVATDNVDLLWRKEHTSLVPSAPGFLFSC